MVRRHQWDNEGEFRGMLNDREESVVCTGPQRAGRDWMTTKLNWIFLCWVVIGKVLRASSEAFIFLFWQNICCRHLFWLSSSWTPYCISLLTSWFLQLCLWVQTVWRPDIWHAFVFYSHFSLEVRMKGLDTGLGCNMYCFLNASLTCISHIGTCDWWYMHDSCTCMVPEPARVLSSWKKSK